jgi:hypothetical protein
MRQLSKKHYTKYGNTVFARRTFQAIWPNENLSMFNKFLNVFPRPKWTRKAIFSPRAIYPHDTEGHKYHQSQIATMAILDVEILEPRLVFKPGGTLGNLFALQSLRSLSISECVYILDFGRGDYKIGKTKLPEQRFVSLADELGAEFVTRYIIKTKSSDDLEKMLHKKVHFHNVFRKEYFNLKRNDLLNLLNILKKETGETRKMSNFLKLKSKHRVTLTDEAYKIAEIEAILQEKTVMDVVSESVLKSCSEESKKMLTRYIMKKPENSNSI